MAIRMANQLSFLMTAQKVPDPLVLFAGAVQSLATVDGTCAIYILEPQCWRPGSGATISQTSFEI